jgi:membrane fusion protein (multidrug efflux system)
MNKQNKIPTMDTRKWVSSIILIACLGACTSKESPKDFSGKSANLNNGYDIGTITQKGLASEVRLPGQLKPFDEVAIYPKANGFVKKVYVDRGSEVKKGQLLIELEAPEVESQLKAAQAQYLQAQEVARASEDKYRRLNDAAKEAGAVSSLDLDNALSKMRGDQAVASSQKANVTSVRSMQGYLTIRAPFDGVVIQRNVSPGALSGASKSGQPMLILQHLQKLRLEVYIPEAYVEKVNLKKSVYVSFTAIPGLNRKAMISRSANSLGDGRSEAIEIDISNDDLVLKPGMYGEVKIPLMTAAHSLLVPNHTIVRSTENQYVIKVVNNKAVLTPIKEGLVGTDSTEIVGDIKPGDKIILHATDEIKDGTAIK